MKKIIGLTLTILILMTITSLGSWAVFNDVETSQTNDIRAGTLDLELNDDNVDASIFVLLTNKAPGNHGDPTANIANTGTLPGKFWIQFSGVTDTPGSTGEYYGGGELSASTKITPWIDTNDNNIFDVNVDYALKSNGTTVRTAIQEDTIYNYCNGATGRSWNPVMASMPAEMATPYVFRLSWSIPTITGNEIQGDSLTFGINFNLDQIP